MFVNWRIYYCVCVCKREREREREKEREREREYIIVCVCVCVCERERERERERVTTSTAARSEQRLKVILTILASFMLEAGLDGKRVKLIIAVLFKRIFTTNKPQRRHHREMAENTQHSC